MDGTFYLATCVLKSASFWILVTNSLCSHELFRHFIVLMMVYGTRVILNKNFLPSVSWGAKMVAHLVFHWGIPIVCGFLPSSPPTAQHTVAMIAAMYAYTYINPDFYEIPSIREEVLLLILMYSLIPRLNSLLAQAYPYYRRE